MKTKITLLMAAVALIMASCSDSGYKKTKSGLVYKLISGGSKDSVVKVNDIVKFHFVRKINDSLLYNSYGKMPGYTQVSLDPGTEYSPLEILTMMKKGDSAVVVEVFDTLIKKGLQAQMPFGKKGDRITTYMKIIDVFAVDSVARKDYEAEMAKDKPRQEQEQKDMQAKRAEEAKKQFEAELKELEKSGEIAKEVKEVEAYIAKKGVTTTKAPGGTYVQINKKGDGEPATTGKYVTVKYSGRLMSNDTTFESNVYIFQLGNFEVIRGWDDGITQFNKGGSGTLYIPGYLAYGKRPGPGGKEFESLIFDIDILNVSTTQEEAYKEKAKADSLAAVGNKVIKN